MPTVGWIQDSAHDRLTDSFPFVRQKPEPIACPLCGKAWADRTALLAHLGIDHPMRRPLLRVGTRVGLDGYELRTPFTPADIEVISATACRVSTNGRNEVLVAPEQLPAFVLNAGNATHSIKLLNSRAVDDREAMASIEVRVAIPQAETLAKIDELFVHHLAHDRITIRMVDEFRRSVTPESAAADYLGALADYAVGVLTKEQRQDSGAHLPFSQFTGKFQSARRCLVDFSRPVATAVVALIDFNLNNFSRGQPAGFPELQNAHHFYCTLTSAGKTNRPVQSGNLVTVAACPVDAVTAAIWQALKLFPEFPGCDEPSPQLPATHDLPLSEFDIAKLRALKAGAALLLNKQTFARDQLRALRHDARFGKWAESHLEAPALS